MGKTITGLIRWIGLIDLVLLFKPPANSCGLRETAGKLVVWEKDTVLSCPLRRGRMEKGHAVFNQREDILNEYIVCVG